MTAVFLLSGGVPFAYGAGTETGAYSELYGLLRVTEADYASSDVTYMLQDGEQSKTLFNKKERSFRVNRPLQISIDKKGALLVRFYSPRPIRDVVVWARLPEMRESFRLAGFKEIRPFAEIRKQLPDLKREKEFVTRSGQVVRLKVNPRDLYAKLELEIACDDPYYKQLTSSLCNWEITFGDFRGENWTPLLPAHAREAVAIALNISVMFSSGEFRNELEKYRGRLFSDNRGTVVQTDRLLKRVYTLKTLNYGRVVGVNGMAAPGGAVFGFNEWCYLSHYADDQNKAHTIFHEFAHTLGFTHEGNMTYINSFGRGWVALCEDIYTRMSLEKKLPVYSCHFLNTRQANLQS